ncbi:glycosyltransferase family protein [Desulfovibrio legallii]|jgi:hypothetical protein|uniref:Glycosyl transferases group 1 n=1 Tax=Desulfovibrio legallii TaxID=571438 RepID=A0A1G7QTV5_9BACT|nr:glycosyltransferase [Desulfovibrio legallii]SDG01299.1 Glycosyl transferases group 1 [Desulfovibrio legallii]
MSERILVLGGGYLSAALQNLGMQAVTVGPGAGAHGGIELDHPVMTARLLHLLAAQGFVPDALFYADNGNLPLLLNPEDFPCPSAFYSIDTYCNPWHVPYARGFDLALAAQKDHLPLFADESRCCRWLPLFYPGALPSSVPPWAGRDVPVSFVGTLGHKNNPDRRPFLERFRRQHPLVCRSGDYRPLFARSRIVLNQTAFSEVNFRVFEAMAWGAALLMERCGNGLTELFRPGENILPVYPRNDAAAAARTAAVALAAPERLERVAAAGRKLVAERHSASARARTLTALLGQARKAGLWRLRLKEEHEACRRAVRTAFAMLAGELAGPALRPHAAFFARFAGA